LLLIDVNGKITSDFGHDDDDGDCCFEFDPISLWEQANKQLNDILFSLIDFSTHHHDLVNNSVSKNINRELVQW
jgi:hypothetical protein